VPECGSPLRVVATKWGDQPHWEFDAVWLGTDAHGTWAGVPLGTEITRPGARVVTDQLQVVLFPPDAGYVATFYADAGQMPCRVYVDITTVPVFSPGRVTSVDLDLDVILGLAGRVWVDDEDEFADHRVRWNYPAAVVDEAVATCSAAEAALTARRAPFDGVHEHWLEVLRGLTFEA
jgi:predicted RNA-binding protein associated with RNAse of E/G family